MFVRAGWVLALAWLGGCGGQAGESGASESEAATSSGITTSSSTTMGPGTSSGSTGEPTTSGSTSGGTTGSVFIEVPDAGDRERCDQWTQDCPEGQKCNAWSGDGDNSWESLKCVDVVRDPDGLYEPCEVFGSAASGEDSCDVGMICWGVDDGIGTCIGFCTGSPDAPDCADPAASCIETASGITTFCLPMCNPLLQDCGPGNVCIPRPEEPNEFACYLDASGDEGQVFDPCEYANACDPGLHCLFAPELASECDPQFAGCCVPFCDTSLANTCPGQGQECIAWLAPEMAPQGYENVGVCGLP
ncbi:hypothetical protein [Nannocystis sp. SCPEA4]|uniref:hypothetical protein n=1 Tax=Nannocystis sp. SCPEA4 TaxID=2996787 RepID=UPI0022717814|nr:hypothetical protein [Nannocystis sp. SCPEA4]MCY1060932.1 hypothetical protein [Nannocystis sp. SCPEA4]